MLVIITIIITIIIIIIIIIAAALALPGAFVLALCGQEDTHIRHHTYDSLVLSVSGIMANGSLLTDVP